jgi:Tol biopolymer transport system component
VPGRGIEPLLASQAAEGWPEVSPDGQWLAYASNASGRYEVYVRPYPLQGAPVVVSLAGDISPAWHPGGGKLFYVEAAYESQSKARMMVVEFAGGAPARVGSPRPLFEFDVARPWFVCRPIRCYDVARDGRRF